ncbi:MAG: hypothetical protein IK066_01695, partial [Kiritimatiellae bacterium]|nr:hypothetical protein [Kiritimatiellia bacterium]
EWNGEAQYFSAERALNYPPAVSARAVAWEQATGDAGWAAWLARMRRKGRPGSGDVERVAGLMGVSAAGWLAGLAWG